MPQSAERKHRQLQLLGTHISDLRCSENSFARKIQGCTHGCDTSPVAVCLVGRVCLVLFSKSAQNEHLPLAEIVCQCNNPAISETCKAFAAISHSIPSLWSTVILRPRQFNIVGPNFLRARLLRTKGAMLTVCIGLVTERTQEFLALCQLLAEYNTQIREFALTAVSRRCCP